MSRFACHNATRKVCWVTKQEKNGSKTLPIWINVNELDTNLLVNTAIWYGGSIALAMLLIGVLACYGVPEVWSWCRSNWTRALLMSALFDVQAQPRADTTSQEQIQISDNTYWMGTYIPTVVVSFSTLWLNFFSLHKNGVVSIITPEDVKFSILFRRKMESKDGSFRLSKWKELICILSRT